MALLGCLGIAYKTTKPSPAPPESTEPPPPPPPPHQSSSSSSSKPSSSSLSSSPSDGDDVGVVGESRIRLRDGRFLAYTERGVPKNKSKFRVIIVHGFGSSKEMSFLAPQVHFSKPQALNFLIFALIEIWVLCLEGRFFQLRK